MVGGAQIGRCRLRRAENYLYGRRQSDALHGRDHRGDHGGPLRGRGPVDEHDFHVAALGGKIRRKLGDSEARPRPGGELGREDRLARAGHQLAMRQDAQIVQVVPVRVRQFRGDRVDAQEEQACDDDGDAGQADRLGRAPVWKSTSVSGDGDDVAALTRSSGEEPAQPRHRAGVASMANVT